MNRQFLLTTRVTKKNLGITKKNLVTNFSQGRDFARKKGEIHDLKFKHITLKTPGSAREYHPHAVNLPLTVK